MSPMIWIDLIKLSYTVYIHT